MKVVSIGLDLALASDRMLINNLYIYEKCKDRNETAHYHAHNYGLVGHILPTSRPVGFLSCIPVVIVWHLVAIVNMTVGDIIYCKGNKVSISVNLGRTGRRNQTKEIKTHIILVMLAWWDNFLVGWELLSHMYGQIRREKVLQYFVMPSNRVTILVVFCESFDWQCSRYMI